MSERTAIPALTPWVDLSSTQALRGTLSPVIDPLAAAAAARAADPLLEELNRNPLPLPPEAPRQPGSSPPKLELSVMARQLAQLLMSDTPVESSSAPVRSLLPAPEAKPEKIAAALQQQITHSGLFYESHLGEWVEGKRGLESLRLEPQSQFTRPAVEQRANTGMMAGGRDTQSAGSPVLPARAAAAVEGARIGNQATLLTDAAGRMAANADATLTLTQRAGAPAMELYSPSGKLNNAPPTPQDLPPAPPASMNRNGESGVNANANAYLNASNSNASAMAAASEGARAASSSEPSAGMQSSKDIGIDPAATTLVRQQLDLLDTQQLQWRGELWPGLPIALQIEQESRRQDRSKPAPDDEPPVWRSVLVSTLPRLGEVTLRLSLAGDRLQLVTRAPSDEASALLSRHVPELESALRRAGITLTSVARDGRPAE